MALSSALGFAPLVACSSTGEEGVPGGTGGASSAAGSGGSSSGSVGSGGGALGSTGGGPLTGTGGALSKGTLTCTGSPFNGPDGKPTGYVECGSFQVHRVAKQACSFEEPAAASAVCATSGSGVCRSNDDCTAASYGRCRAVGSAYPSCGCEYGCETDGDCPGGSICLCNGSSGSCAEASCSLDSDCSEGRLCLSYAAGCGREGFACTTPDDECHSRADCVEGYCAFQSGAFRCLPRDPCYFGRPFLIGGAARVAGVSLRADWCSRLVPDTGGLDAAALGALAEYWANTGLMEHASIAAFARFALELLALGAPASLVEETHAAIADETAHARDAFALASGYAGERLGPGKFDAAASSMQHRSAEDVVVTAIIEGCIGETVAAVEAAEALSRAEDPAVRQALAKITADESRHAALAWRFVQWVIVEDAAGLRDVALRALDAVVRTELAAASASAPDRQDLTDPALAAHGLMTSELRARLRRAVLSEVIAPAANALRASAKPPQDMVILRNGIVTTKTAPQGWLSST